jgi:elongation of very long chain fatty acids protein 4
VYWDQWDKLVADAVFGAIEKTFDEEIRSKPCPHTYDLPGVKTPTVLVTWALVYLFIVGVGLVTITPADKGKKKPLPAYLKTFISFHNIFLILLSSFMFVNSCYQAYTNNYNFWAQPYDVKEVHMAYGIYIFYISKLYEYFDTYIMLLKGNLKQVSFLHVYHHLSISMIWWTIAYSAPGGDAWYSAALNSLVHVAMYTYYYLASLSSSPDFRRKYLWWGKYMTSFQMAQFLSMLVQGIYCTMHSGYPKWLSKLIVVYMVTLLILFGNFFAKKYLSGGSKKQKQK